MLVKVTHCWGVSVIDCDWLLVLYLSISVVHYIDAIINYKHFRLCQFSISLLCSFVSHSVSSSILSLLSLVLSFITWCPPPQWSSDCLFTIFISETQVGIQLWFIYNVCSYHCIPNLTNFPVVLLYSDFACAGYWFYPFFFFNSVFKHQWYCL
jgi:hypothetical protein